jgi:uncharacterized protein YndB with AHSA1/START domain
VSSIEVARPPEQVFSYVTDPARLPEWQENLLSSRLEGGGAVAVGSRITQTRRIGIGRIERTMTLEMTELDPPRRWTVRGIDGPVRAIARGEVAALGDGQRSEVTINLDFEGHGIGKVLVPVLVRPQTRRGLPASMQMLKERIEGSA